MPKITHLVKITVLILLFSDLATAQSDLIKLSEDLKIKKALAEVRRRVAYCYNCQPYDEGEYIWIFGKEYGTLREMSEDVYYDLFGDDLPVDFEIPAIDCPNCGTELDELSSVGIEVDNAENRLT